MQRKINYITFLIILVITASAGILLAQNTSFPSRISGVLNKKNKGYLESIQSPQFKIASNGKYIEDEIIVKFKSNTGESFKAHSLRSLGGTSKSILSNTDHHVVKISEKDTVASAVQAYSNLPGVEYAQPNYVYKMTSTTPNDPNYAQQWAAKNTNQTIVKMIDDLYINNNPPPGVGYDAGLENAWDMVTDCSSVTVAVLDTGVNFEHEELKSNMWEDPSCNPHWYSGGTSCKYGADIVDGDETPLDYNGHGTHVAGIIAAKGNNGVGTAGVCWTAKIMAVRVLDRYGNGTSSTVVAGINYGLLHGAKVINMSLDGTSYDPSMLNAIILGANTYDALFVVAAGSRSENLGNSGTNRYPCELPAANIVCVGATDQKGYLAQFSNYDNSATASARAVDFLAPGTNILSTYNTIQTGYLDGDLSSGWNFSGTSSNDWAIIPDMNSCYAESPIDHSVYPGLGFPNGCNSYPILPNTNSYFYKVFDFSQYNEISMGNRVKFEVNDGGDNLTFKADPNGGDPITDGLIINRLFQDPANTFENYYSDLTFCTTTNCSVGFQLTTDSDSIVPYSILIRGVGFSWAKANNSSYNVLNGTSMATPYVAGTAAMLRTYQPNFTYLDAYNALVNSGNTDPISLANTKYGTTLNAHKALLYLHPPVISSITQQ